MSQDGSRDSLTNVEAVTYALAELGGIDRPVHLEDVAVKAYTISPGAFRWDLKEYENFIDKDKVRVSLVVAERPTSGNLVKQVGVSSRRSGSKKADYWRLTSDGVSWVLEHSERVGAVVGGPTSRLNRTATTNLRRRLTTSSLYTGYKESGEVTPDSYGFSDLLECSPDASVSVIQQRFDELMAKARLLDDDELVRFLELCADAHSDMLDGEVKSQ
jgi:hypothetical protein